ncbi:alpha/beta hydrolase [Lentibacillus cibarius]|uniref:Esterase family protein n=1 Tax=Lentibacillus cibarius TaxID=2583219 RepID=A0A5S3QPJ2_9BACI|nr:alpha/beta hydrolase-fold protein [Lentibacillus cibarius]TMN23902.1 esterase family protein [Lentibacillus cibarius]
MGRKGTMLEEQIESHHLNETMTVKIYLPEAFTPFYKYHLCIMQDGNDYYQLGRAATLSDQMHEDGDMEHTILVGIHYKDKYDRREKYHPAGSQQQAYMKFLVQEAVPFLDKLLPTYCMGQSRALIGDSLAGTLALMTALKYPNSFGYVIMQSPYVDAAVLEAVKKSETRQQVSIYHTVGTAETAVATTDGGKADFVAPNRELNQLLQEKGLPYTYHELENGNHTWKYWQSDLQHAFLSLFN